MLGETFLAGAESSQAWPQPVNTGKNPQLLWQVKPTPRHTHALYLRKSSVADAVGVLGCHLWHKRLLTVNTWDFLPAGLFLDDYRALSDARNNRKCWSVPLLAVDQWWMPQLLTLGWATWKHAVHHLPEAPSVLGSSCPRGSWPLTPLYSFPIAAATDFHALVINTTHIYYLMVLEVKGQKWAEDQGAGRCIWRL